LSVHFSLFHHPFLDRRSAHSLRYVDRLYSDLKPNEKFGLSNDLLPSEEKFYKPARPCSEPQA
jgi:hypothetical protein